MYQELTKKIADEESEGDESSDVDGDDDSSRSSESDQSFGFPTKIDTQSYTINPRKDEDDTAVGGGGWYRSTRVRLRFPPGTGDGPRPLRELPPRSAT